jgi:hypothetical protein
MRRSSSLLPSTDGRRATGRRVGIAKQSLVTMLISFAALSCPPPAVLDRLLASTPCRPSTAPRAHPARPPRRNTTWCPPAGSEPASRCLLYATLSVMGSLNKLLCDTSAPQFAMSLGVYARCHLYSPGTPAEAGTISARQPTPPLPTTMSTEAGKVQPAQRARPQGQLHGRLVHARQARHGRARDGRHHELRLDHLVDRRRVAQAQDLRRSQAHRVAHQARVAARRRRAVAQQSGHRERDGVLRRRPRRMQSG